MQVIKNLVEQIDEELEDAQKYIKCAYKMKDDYPELAQTYFRLSKEEMTHVNLLHDQIVRIIDAYKQKNGEVPDTMKVLYEYLHGRHIDWAEKIELKQKNFNK